MKIAHPMVSRRTIEFEVLLVGIGVLVNTVDDIAKVGISLKPSCFILIELLSMTRRNTIFDYLCVLG